MSLFYSGVKSGIGLLASPTPHPVEPENHFEPFEHVRESCEELANGVSILNGNSRKSSGSRIITSPDPDPDASSAASSPARSSALLSSLSSPGRVGISAEGEGLRESSQVLAGFGRGRESRAIAARPSPASRLGFIDRKWLERCQVFGEMEAEVKPGAGNQDNSLDKRGERERSRAVEEKTLNERGRNEETHAEGAKRGAKELGKDEEFTPEIIVSNSAPKVALQHMGRKQGGDEKETSKQGEEMEVGLTRPTSEDISETNHKSKKRGRKRQREEENKEVERTVEEEGVVKKRRKYTKKTEERSDVDPGPAEEGGKKKRVKKKGDEGGEAKEKKESPKRVSQFFRHVNVTFLLCKCIQFSTVKRGVSGNGWFDCTDEREKM